jgi:hypothetical protein
MSQQEAITAPEFSRLLTSADFCGQLDDILLYSNRTHGNAGFAVYRAAGELILSDAMNEHDLHELTRGDDGLARPDLAVAVHTHSPNIFNFSSGLLSPRDLAAHILLDNEQPGVISMVAKQFGYDFESGAFTTLHMTRRTAAIDAPPLGEQIVAVSDLPTFPRFIPEHEAAMAEVGLASVRGRYSAPHLLEVQLAEQAPPKYQPGAANLTRQLFWGVPR